MSETPDDAVGRTPEVIAQRMRRRAAVTGAFDPGALAPEGGQAAVTRRALALLAADCRETERGGAVLWTLLPDPRRRTLAGLAGQRDELTALLDENPPAEGDRFAHALQGVLRGEPVNVGEVERGDLEALHSVLEIASSLAPPAAVLAPREVRRRIARQEREDALRFLLPHDLFGRVSELRALRSFVRNGTVPARYQPKPKAGVPPLAGDRVRVLLVTGIGGVGKSALLAKLVGGLESAGMPAVILDFDRPTLNSADPIAMLFEVTRQLAIAHPNLDAVLSRFREEVRQRVEGIAIGGRERFEVLASLVTGAFASLRETLAGNGLNRKPLLLVLDTFEEVMVCGPFETDYVFTWLDGLQAEAGFGPLRVVVSGRVAPTEVVDALHARFTAQLDLGDLNTRAAVAMLTGLDVSPAFSEQLARVFGGNPLVLKFLAQYRQRDGEDALRRLLPDDDGRSRLTGMLAQKFLYSRILERIREPAVRKLAHPGLVLRRVTPDLIDAVLAGPCGLGSLRPGEADVLFEQLAGQIWLVNREGKRAVRHRRDLRRLMLGQMLDDPDDVRRAAVHVIHQAAAAYYEAGRDPELPQRQQRLEAVYHRFFDNDATPDISEELADELFRSLGGDLDDLPPQGRALLKLRAGRSLSDAEIALLPVGLQREMMSERRYKRLQKGGRGSVLEAGSVATDKGNWSKEWIEATFSEARFEELGALSGPALQEFFRNVTELPIRPRDQITDSGLWKILMAALFTGRQFSTDYWSEAQETLFDGIFQSVMSRQGKFSTYAVALFACYIIENEYDRAKLISFMAEREFSDEYIIRTRSEQIVLMLSPFFGTNFGKISLYCRIVPIFFRGHTHRQTPFNFEETAGVVLEDYMSFSRQYLATRNGLSTIKQFRFLVDSSKNRRVFFEPVANARKFSYMKSTIRGLTPELYSAIWRNIIDAFDQIQKTLFLEKLREKSDFWLEELLPDHFLPASTRDPARWFAVLVEFCDHCGMLGDLLGIAEELAPENERLRKVGTLYRAYDGLLNSCIDSRLKEWTLS